MSYEVRIDGTEVLKNLGELNERAKKALEVAGERTGMQMATYAKQNAKWTDRTGAARGGLKHECKWEGSTLSIGVMHSVDYGLWLEVRNFPHAGRLAILEEARDSQIEGFLRMIKGIFK